MGISMCLRQFCVAVFCVFAVGTAGACPDACSCAGDVVDCSGRNLTEIPEGLPANVSDLDLGHNSIAALNGSVLSEYPGLAILDLSYNLLEYIEPGTFYNLSSLRQVNLEANRLRSIAQGAFELVELDELGLKDNRILAEIAPNAFLNATVQTLDLSGCNFTTLHRGVITGMEATLRVFVLNRNAAPLQLEASFFAGFELDELILVNSNIGDVVFLREVKVKILELEDNPLGDGVWSLQWADSGVEELYLQGVGLTRVNITQAWSTLTVLNLADNPIARLQAEDLLHTPNLNSLILRNTLLGSIPMQLGTYLGSLKILDLGTNSIQALEPSHLDNLTLDTLDLQNNLIQSLDEGLKAKFDSLRELKLEDNLFHCNCELQWFRKWIKSLSSSETSVSPSDCVTPEDKAGALLQLRLGDFLCVPPTVISSEPTSIHEGDDVKLKCQAKGDPPPDIRLETPWGEEFTSEPTTNKTLEKVELTHEVKDYDCTRDGDFICTASNVEGQDVDGSSLVCISASTEQPDDDNGDDDDDDDDDSKNVIIIVVVVLLVIVAIICVVAVCWRKKIKRAYNVSPKRSRNTNVDYVNKAMEEN